MIFGLATRGPKPKTQNVQQPIKFSPSNSISFSKKSDFCWPDLEQF
jgi:hypothetical protein